LSVALGHFDIREFEPSLRHPDLTVAEWNFILRSAKEGRASLYIVSDKKKRIRIFLSGLIARLSVLLSYTPRDTFTHSDLGVLRELRDEIAVSPRAEELIRDTVSDRLDFDDRISRLLNLNSYLLRGAEYKQCSHELFDAANTFAENLSFLCGGGLFINREYPEVCYPDGFDSSALGLILISAIGERGEDELPPRLAFHSEDGKLFAELFASDENSARLAPALRLTERFNFPLSLECERGMIKLSFCPMRPEASLLGLKQPNAIENGEDEENPFEYD